MTNQTNKKYSSYCDEDRHDSCTSLVLSNEGGCDCDCHDFNREENKKFDTSGKQIAKFIVNTYEVSRHTQKEKIRKHSFSQTVSK